jgi:hypothetical protein
MEKRNPEDEAYTGLRSIPSPEKAREMLRKPEQVIRAAERSDIRPAAMWERVRKSAARFDKPAL